MDEFTELDTKLARVLKDHPELELRRLGWVNLGSYAEPDMRHGAMFVTRERVDERGKVWAFVGLPEDLVENPPLEYASLLLIEAEEAVKLQKSA